MNFYPHHKYHSSYFTIWNSQKTFCLHNKFGHTNCRYHADVIYIITFPHLMPLHFIDFPAYLHLCFHSHYLHYQSVFCCCTERTNFIYLPSFSTFMLNLCQRCKLCARFILHYINTIIVIKRLGFSLPVIVKTQSGNLLLTEAGSFESNINICK